MNRFSPAGLGILASTVVLLGGCSVLGEVTNRGGDTTCKEFNGLNDEKRNSAISKMLKDQHGGEPSNLELSAVRTAASLYCTTIGKGSSKIREASFG